MVRDLISSKFIINQCNEAQVIVPQASEFSDTVDDIETQKLRLDAFDDDTPPSDKIFNYKSDPYAGNCSWTQEFEGEEVAVYLSLSEIDFYQYSFQMDQYTTTYPGIMITINRGARSKYGLGSVYDPGKVVSYVYAPSFRADASQLYQEYSILVANARVRGLEGVQFPQNWDEIPYTI